MCYNGTMDIKDLNKSQLILLTLLVSFVVSIATGITTVSLMQKIPTSASQTINRVIRETVNKVTQVEVPAKETSTPEATTLPSGNLIANIYLKNTLAAAIPSTDPNAKAPVPIGEGVVISDTGLIMVDSSILTTDTTYDIKLNNENFTAQILKKFGNGFTILEIKPDANTATDSSVKSDASKTDQTSNTATANKTP